MSAARPEDDRNVIPRWRDPFSTARQGELTPASSGDGDQLEVRGDISDREAAWKQHRSLSFATDLVGSALVVGSSPAGQEAAEFVVGNEHNASPLAVSVARQLLDPGADSRTGFVPEPESGQLGAAIRELRQRLRRDPRNTLAWSEIARFETIAGNRPQATRAMKVAMGLSPDHRYVLRAASRLAIHHGDFEKAHSVVAASRATAQDPWLIATELATAGLTDRRPRMTRRGETMLHSSGYSPRATTELASALATLQLHAGADRHARRLFQRSLDLPNENSIAQGEWASGRLKGLEVSQDQLEHSSEATTLRFGKDGAWREALTAAWEWQRDQPFASGPGETGSYYASLGQAYEEGARIAERALRANPGEFMLTNNLAFCLINLGRLRDAGEWLKRVDVEQLDNEDAPTYWATVGLLAFRSGDAETGRDLYRRSIDRAPDRKHKMIATILLAREELKRNSPFVDALLQEVEDLQARVPTAPDIKLWLKQLPIAHLSK